MVVIGWIFLQFGDTLRRPALLSDDFFNIKIPYYDFSVWTHLKGFLAPNNSYNNRPLGSLIYVILFSVFKSEPFPYIFLLFCLHIANSILVFLISCYLAKDKFVALICSLIFATFYKSADNIYSFPIIFDNLSFFWWALALVLYIDNRQASSKGKYIGSLVCFFLSIRAKEIGVTLSPALLLYELIYNEGLWKGFRGFLSSTKNILRKQFAFHLIAVLFIIFYVSGSAYGLQSARDYPYYLELSTKSFLEGLSFYLKVDSFLERWFKNFGLIIFVITVLFGLISRKKTVIWGSFTFLITLLPVIFLVNARRNYYFYMPSFGLILAMMGMIECTIAFLFRGSKNLRRIAVYVVIIIVFGLYIETNTKRVNDIRRYYENIRTSTNTTIALLKSYCPSVPRASKLYFVSVPPWHILNIDLGLQYMPMVIYEDTSICAMKVENRKDLQEKVAERGNVNFYVFEFIGNIKKDGSQDYSNGKIIDISREFR
jgi:hypothetical protein